MDIYSADEIGAKSNKAVSVVSGSNANKILHDDVAFQAPFLVIIESFNAVELTITDNDVA